MKVKPWMFHFSQKKFQKKRNNWKNFLEKLKNKRQQTVQSDIVCMQKKLTIPISMPQINLELCLKRIEFPFLQ